MPGDPRYRFRVAEADGVVAGFAIAFAALEDLWLLEYMAVSPERRNGGLGARLFAAVRPERGVLLVETESEREACPERELRVRRKTFYRRLGCREVEGLDYLLPLPGDGPPPLIDILALGAGEAVALGTLRAWLTAVYVGAYDCTSDDARIGRMLAPLPDPVRLA